jgi:hypothetical protein
MAIDSKTKKKAAPAKAAKGRRAAPVGIGNGKKACTIEGCKRGYRAKGYCFFHYKKWRHGELPHGRYKTCSTLECRKPVAEHGLCADHFKAWVASRKGAVVEAPAAAPAPAPEAAKPAEPTPAAP